MAKLRELGHEVVIESKAGSEAGISDEAYRAAGAEIGDAWACPMVMKVRPPSPEEILRLQEGALLVSLLQPERNAWLLPLLAERKVSALALERVPRITRAQKMDVLSSMGNLAGYRAVLEAAAAYEGAFGPQVTAAGSMPPVRVLVIGAGVAGLAAVGAARALGAEVRAFDTRAAAREQVESLGATFLEVQIQESGEGGGGYGKLMSPEFIAAEMALFKAQAAECKIAITTALVPGAKAPILLPTDVVECFAPGSVIVDLAAEQGGNCELTVPGEAVVHRGVTILGYTDLASRMASTASRFFAMNLYHLATELGRAESFAIDLENDVIRPALVLHRGEELPRPPPPAPPAPPAPHKASLPAPPPRDAKPAFEHPTQPGRGALGTTVGGVVLIAALFTIGRFAPGEFLQHFTVFILSCFIGWQVIWAVTPALHTPLMSVTNAISGIIIVGGMLQIAARPDLPGLLGAVAVLVAAINVAGGFLVTHRMLKMFSRGGSAG